MDWPTRLRVLEKLSAPSRQYDNYYPGGYPDMNALLERGRPRVISPFMSRAPTTPYTLGGQTNSMTNSPYRTPLARSTANRQANGAWHQAPYGADAPVTPTVPAVPAVKAVPAVPAVPAQAGPVPGATPEPLAMKHGRGYGWLAKQLNAGRPKEEQIGWKDLRKAMGGQTLHDKHDYGALRGLTREQALAGGGAIAMPWHKTDADLQRDISNGKRLSSARAASARAMKALKSRQTAASAASMPSPMEAPHAAPVPSPTPAPAAAMVTRAGLPMAPRMGMAPMSSSGVVAPYAPPSVRGPI